MAASLPRLYVPEAPGAAALEELDAVPWAQLDGDPRHRHGPIIRAYQTRNPFTGERIAVPARSTPGIDTYLRQLMSPDAEERAEALGSCLWEALYHQGSLSQATVYAIPFLWALLVERQCQVRGDIVLSLSAILQAALRRDQHREAVLGAFTSSDLWMQRLRADAPDAVVAWVDRVRQATREPETADAALEDRLGQLENAVCTVWPPAAYRTA